MCLQEFDRPCNQIYRFTALANICLTSRRFASLVLPLLFGKITAKFTSVSLQRLEKLSKNPRIAGSVTHITIALPCYNPETLKNFSRFILARIESIENDTPSDDDIPMGYDPMTTQIHPEIKNELDRVISIWQAIRNGDRDVDYLGENMKLLKQSHKNYKKSYRDQLKHKPVTLLSKILKRLNHLQQISIDDSVYQLGRIDEKGDLVLALESGYIPADSWLGSEFDPSATPRKLIADIFDALEMASVHPERFELVVRDDILESGAFQMSPECLVRISDVLRGTESLYISVLTVFRKYENTEFVGPLTRALCDVASLQKLHLSFFSLDGCHPATSVLPLGKTIWPHLKSLRLGCIAFTREEFKMLLAQCNKDVLEDVFLCDLTLRDFSRQDACDDLKSFKKVRKIAWSDSRYLEFDSESTLEGADP
ncbi:hypothetical protein DTO271G3_8098 [Paecilomyces variotii]|nr:hypothetical protein DTO271G3_8098 [Paecilomyces variotii]